MSKIEQAKTYTGTDMETIFFRPMMMGPNALALGVKVMYNMPVPTHLHFWKRSGDILQKFAGGWNGSDGADKFQKSIELKRVKAEVGYSADKYFDLIYEKVLSHADGHLDDLTGTALEAAETALFKEAIAESIRATMWVGDTTRTGSYNTFDGFIKRILEDRGTGEKDIASVTFNAIKAPEDAETMLKQLWENASELLRACKADGNLVYLVTSDIYMAYEDALDSVILDSAYQAKQTGRERLSYRGIPVVDMQIGTYLSDFPTMPATFAILTDRRNLALAVNTTHFPGSEVKMWYNPDLMENRQRAVFMAGCDYLLPELLSIGFVD
ncbi:MAG: hypothetical protein LUF87_03665 [Alistipes sp.]|nr:hypothetical protein [Alistipes sp.]